MARVDCPRRSLSSATSRTRFAERDLAGMPSLDLRPQPEAWAAGAKVKDRPWHVWISALVLTYGVAVAEPEDSGNIVSVDQVVE